MGAPMARRLLDAGYNVHIFNRTGSKLGEFRDRGACISTEPEKILAETNVYISMLTDYAAFRQVILLPGSVSFQEKTVIQMATVAPGENREAGDIIAAAGGRFLEAPVLGSIPQAQTGKLIIFTGGDTALLQDFNPLLSSLGEKIVHFGAVGEASAVKLALNQFIASMTAAFSMSLGYLREQGADINKFMEVLRSSSLHAPTFDKKFQRMMDREFSNPNFPVKHMLKDVELIINDFSASGVSVRPLVGVLEILNLAMNRGEADSDYSALYNAIHPPA